MILSNFKKFQLFVILLSIYPHNSHQVDTINATCIYSVDSRNNYLCTIDYLTSLNPTDVLNIIGTHLEGYSDINVERVSHRDSKIYYFNGEIFRKFENLKYLDLFGVDLREISPTAFDVCPNLVELLIGNHNNFTAFPPQMLQNCGNLKLFRSLLQSTTEVPADLFGSTSNLERFDMSYNKLTSLPENLLQNMQNLIYFDISRNSLAELSPNLLRNAQNLEEFYIGNNKFTDQQQITNVLNGFTNLKALWLADNNFTNFDFGFLEQFQKLEGLLVGSKNGPQLIDISWQSLPGSLIELYVYGIGEEIPENSFDNRVNLTSLTLTGLGIENLQKDTFKALANLDLLDIQDTSIKTLNPELFTSQIKLRGINLSNNKIEELPAGIFTPLVNLGQGGVQGIRMASNNIQRLNSNSFGQHPLLQRITFQSNRINEIERGLFSHFHPNMTNVNFWSNVCIDRLFTNPSNLDESDDLLWCFNHWAGITTTTTTSTSTTTSKPPTTTPNGSGADFTKFEVFAMIFVSFLGIFVNFVM